MLTRFVRIQLVIFTVAGLVGMFTIAFKYLQVQSFLGVGRLDVVLELPASGGLYQFSNVTYRGVQVGKVTNVDAVRTGTTDSVRATLSLDTSEKIPADLTANVRSMSAIGEQYVDLVPKSSQAPYLHEGSVIPMADTRLPQPVGPMLDKTSELIGSIPKDQLHRATDELYRGFKGADFDIQSLFDSTATLAAAADGISEPSKSLIQDSAPLLDTQTQSGDAIRTWTRSLTAFTGQLVANDPQIRTILQKGPEAANEASRLFDQLNPTIPVLLANLTTMGQLAITYHPGIEQILVLLPPAVSIVQAVNPNRNASGLGLGTFRMTVSDPPACTVGFLPPSSWRPPYDTTTIDTPDGLYCKLPQDSPIAVRGVRNIPCMTKPGKRAPTAEMCNSDQGYEALAQKQPFLGPYPRDPNLEAQGIPPDSRWFPDQGLYSAPGLGPPAPNTPPPTPPTTALVPPPAGNADAPFPPPNLPASPPPTDTPAVPPPSDTPPLPPMPQLPEDTNAPASFSENGSAEPPVEFIHYNPRTGEYFAQDGNMYRQTDLASVTTPRTWNNLLLNDSP
jgi:virulence factor Mce-like protein